MGLEGAASPDRGSPAAPAIVGAAELDVARLGLHRAFPARSAKRRLHITQALWMAALCAAVAAAFYYAPAASLRTLHAGAIAVFGAAILIRFAAALRIRPVRSRLAEPAAWPTYTVLCPLYREANVVPELVAALRRIDYPARALDIKLLIEADDEDTLDAARRAVGDADIELVSVPPARPRTKPKALNVGLGRARGDFVVVYDAEDRPHPHQLRAALAAFEDGGERLACVQAPLDIDNAGASWIARQFAAEYAIQFHEILPLLAGLGLPLPLGGSSNHFRTEALRAAGGWDAFNVTEDADIGYRLARNGLRAGVIGPPTSEEAPVSFGAWFRQRTRWIKGHMQTWLVLMRNPLRTASEMGLAGFMAMQLLLVGGLAAAFVHGPLACIVAIAALSPYTLLTPADLMLAACGYGVALFAAAMASLITRTPNHLLAAVTMPFYWPLASLAAVWALVELLARPHHWSKTEHGVSERSAPALLKV